MDIRLFALKIHIPSFIKKNNLKELFELTAEAFGCEVPPLNNLSYVEMLKAYAQFTAEEAEKHIRERQNLEGIKGRLHDNAYRLGKRIREDFGLHTTQEIMEMSRILYQTLGIDFEGDLSGEVTIKKCFFSDYYSPQVCRVISSLDEGIAAGLSDGGRLSFSKRITEGNPCCRARLFRLEEKA
jgi:hypothetical protein